LELSNSVVGPALIALRFFKEPKLNTQLWHVSEDADFAETLDQPGMNAQATLHYAGYF
jgi:hypothetical protein